MLPTIKTLNKKTRKNLCGHTICSEIQQRHAFLSPELLYSHYAKHLSELV